MNYAVQMGSGAKIFIPNIINFISDIQKLIGRIHRHTDSMDFSSSFNYVPCHERIWGNGGIAPCIHGVLARARLIVLWSPCIYACAPSPFNNVWRTWHPHPATERSRPFWCAFSCHELGWKGTLQPLQFNKRSCRYTVSMLIASISNQLENL
jgi:hypothetical protein